MFLPYLHHPKCEEVDADLEFIFDERDLIVGDWEGDLIETLFAEEALLLECPLGIFLAMVKGKQHRIAKAAVISSVEFDDRVLHPEEVW